MISLPSPSKFYSVMNTNDITVTLTECQHEMLNDVLMNAIEAYHLVSPHDMGMHELPIDNPIIQRYTTLENLKELFYELWRDRWEQ